MTNQQLEVLGKQITKALTPIVRRIAERMALEGIKQINQSADEADRVVTRRDLHRFIHGGGGVRFNGDGG